jgi:hypothetical protein
MRCGAEPQWGQTMDQSVFDDVTRALASSRRSLLGGMLALAGGWLGDSGAEAGSKRKRKPKKPKPTRPKPNTHGCLNVGQPCNGDSAACCSSICEGSKPKKGKPDKSRCVAHDAGICRTESDICSGGGEVFCDTGNDSCACVVTTGNATFCGQFRGMPPEKFCSECSRDSDCEDEFGRGAACIVYSRKCNSLCPGAGTACVPACRDLAV